MNLSETDKSELLKLARKTIQQSVQTGQYIQTNTDAYEESLKQHAACFVTLTKHKQLRGCIGHLEAIQPLVDDVIENAYSAAFRDPRFSAVTNDELAEIEIDISVLTPAEPMTFSDEADLLSQIQPQVDGLILEDGYHRGTFLPSVWESLPDKEEFWKHLKTKAGLTTDHWSDSLKVSRYRTLMFSE